MVQNTVKDQYNTDDSWITTVAYVCFMYSVQWGKSLFACIQNSTGSCMLYNMMGSCWDVII